MLRGLSLTYMLPPTLSLVPNRDVKLWILIAVSYTKPYLPHPDCNLTDSLDYVWPNQDIIKSEIEEFGA